MFDKYLIVDGSLRNTGPEDAPVGFAVDVKLGYYRGLGLSMVEALNLTIDGAAIPPEKIRFDEGKGELTLQAMSTTFDRRWHFGTRATLTVDRPGGLTAGTHRVALMQVLRVSYMPFPSRNADAKDMTIAMRIAAGVSS